MVALDVEIFLVVFSRIQMLAMNTMSGTTRMQWNAGTLQPVRLITNQHSPDSPQGNPRLSVSEQSSYYSRELLAFFSFAVATGFSGAFLF